MALSDFRNIIVPVIRQELKFVQKRNYSKVMKSNEFIICQHDVNSFNY